VGSVPHSKKWGVGWLGLGVDGHMASVNLHPLNEPGELRHDVITVLKTLTISSSLLSSIQLYPQNHVLLKSRKSKYGNMNCRIKRYFKEANPFFLPSSHIPSPSTFPRSCSPCPLPFYHPPLSLSHSWVLHVYYTRTTPLLKRDLRGSH